MYLHFGILPTLIIVAGVLIARHYGWLPDFRGSSQGDVPIDISPVNVFDNNSLLVKLRTVSSHLEKVSSGTVTGVPYEISVTVPNPVPVTDEYNPSRVAVEELYQAAKSNAPTVIMRLQIPKPSPIHIVCLGGTRNTLDGALVSLVANMELEPASLEGDFPDYFRLYCSKDQQVALRQVLDPVTMAFLVDYCTKQDWEVVGDTLYFSQTTAEQKQAVAGTTPSPTIVQNAEEFLAKTSSVFARLYGSNPGEYNDRTSI